MKWLRGHQKPPTSRTRSGYSYETEEPRASALPGITSHLDTTLRTGDHHQMGAISDLWKSERGLVAITLILAISVLTALGSFTNLQWLDYTQWLATVYIGSKTVTGAVQLLKSTPPLAPPVESLGSLGTSTPAAG